MTSYVTDLSNLCLVVSQQQKLSLGYSCLQLLLHVIAPWVSVTVWGRGVTSRVSQDPCSIPPTPGLPLGVKLQSLLCRVQFELSGVSADNCVFFVILYRYGKAKNK